MSDKKADEQYTSEETARRRDEALRRALNTPPKPRKQDSGRASKAKTGAKGPKNAR